jgi:hypothetical protein
MDEFPSDDNEIFRALDDEVASELDAVSEQLFAATESMQAVATMSEPVRADAISIARDILRLLKVTFGEVTVLSGLNLKSREEGLALGGLTAVGEIYSQLLAWARGIDGSIMSDPSVLAAIDAFGVIGYMAKREALRIARTSKDMFLATSLAQQLDTIGGKYLNPQEKNVGKLLERIEHGIDRVLNRVQDITLSGVAVSQSKNELGGGNKTAPIAGQALQQNANAINSRDAGNARNAEALAAEQLAAQAETARIAARAKKEGRQPAPARPAPGANRQPAQPPRAQTPRPPSTNAIPTAVGTANTTAAQMQNRITNARMANIHNEQSHHEEEHHQQEQQALQRQLAAARDAARKAAAKATATAAAQKQQVKPAINADMLKGFKGFDTSGMKPVPEPVKPPISSQSVTPSNGLKPPPTPPVPPVIDPITNQPIGGKGVGR